MNGGVEVGHARVDAGAQHAHVDEGGADVDDDLRTGAADECPRGLDVQRVQCVGLQNAGPLQAAPGVNAVDDLLAFGQTSGNQVDGTEFLVVLGAFVGHDVAHTARANDQDVFFHARMTFRMRRDGVTADPQCRCGVERVEAVPASGVTTVAGLSVCPGLGWSGTDRMDRKSDGSGSSQRCWP